MKILFSWIGHADLLGFAGKCPDAQAQVYNLIKKQDFTASGPVKIAISQKKFDRVILLCNYDAPDLMEQYRQYCGEHITIIHTPIANPTDYRAVYCAVLDVVEANCAWGDELHYLLSPGTPAMAAVWVLLGKTKFPGKFLQTYNNDVSYTEIPFDMTADLLPDLLNKTDRLIENLPDVSQVAGFEDIVGNSPAIRETVLRASKAAMHSVPVLITGESGTGKEMFARAIWKASPRKDKPFEAINCAALPANLLEAELFGYKKGAFTGAVRDRDGAFKRLNGGTLFLDEIGECSLELQAKLLRVLQPPPGKSLSYREFYPVGSEQPEHSDVRIIAATNRNLPEMIAQQQFRDDLFYRLSAITLPLPPLRERKGDILLLAEKLLQRINADFKRELPGYNDKYFCENTKKFIQNHPWRGNVRELFNAILQGAVMSGEKNIKIFDMGFYEAVSSPEKALEVPEITDGFSLDNTLETIEKQYISAAVKQSGGNKSKAARLLGFSNYQRLDARIKKLKIQPELE